MDDLDALARSIMDVNSYLTLGTADRDGLPWVTPVYYACANYRDFYWISRPDATHSRNLVGRPQVSMVVFDSRVPVYTGQAVYLSGTAGEVAEADLDRALAVYPGPPERGVRPVTRDRVTGAAGYRLYRARVTEHFVVCPHESGRCPRHGVTGDHRAAVTP